VGRAIDEDEDLGLIVEVGAGDRLITLVESVLGRIGTCTQWSRRALTVAV
jgi:hypothetical protein